jgi:hypothetical protein
MSDRFFGGLVASWFCLIWPALTFGAGLLIGKYGVRHAVTLALLKVFGTSEGETP